MKIKFRIGKTWGKGLTEGGLGIKFKKTKNLFIHIRLFVWMLTIGFIKKPQYTDLCTEEELEDMEAHAFDLVLGAMVRETQDKND